MGYQMSSSMQAQLDRDIARIQAEVHPAQLMETAYDPKAAPYLKMLEAKISREDKTSGVLIQVLSNGTQKQLDPDGTVLVAFPDGTQFQTLPDNTVAHVYSDGWTFESWDDGTTIEQQPDGTKVQKGPDGDIITQEPDGTTTMEMPDGTTVVEKPQPGGTLTVQTNPDGTTITLYPDGIKVQVSPDGTTITVYPDGKQINGPCPQHPRQTPKAPPMKDRRAGEAEARQRKSMDMRTSIQSPADHYMNMKYMELKRHLKKCNVPQPEVDDCLGMYELRCLAAKYDLSSRRAA